MSQPFNSTQSQRRCRISSKPYSPYPKSYHLPKIVRLLPAILASPSHTLLYTVKAGYPPRALTAVIPELPLSSLGLAPGDQLIVVQKSGSAAPLPPPGVTSAAPTLSSPVNPAYPGHTPAAAARPAPSSSNPRQAEAPRLSTTTEDNGPDYVAMDGSYLIHRVRG